MITRARDHADNCDWHFDQYPWECTCGATKEKPMTTETITIDMNWQATLPLLLTVYRDGNPQGQREAFEELQRMARLADLYVSQQQATPPHNGSS